MTLPATYTEALEREALAFSRDWIVRAFAAGALFHPGTGLVSLMKEFALAHPLCADDVVYLAEKGSPEADRALREIIAERADRGESLGAVFGAYAIKLVNPARGRSGPARAGNFRRDVGLIMLMADLMDRFGLAAHHNPAARRPAASTIAAAALTAAGFGSLNHKAAEKIWRRYLPAFAGSRFAASSRRFALGLPADAGGLFG